MSKPIKIDYEDEPWRIEINKKREAREQFKATAPEKIYQPFKDLKLDVNSLVLDIKKLSDDINNINEIIAKIELNNGGKFDNYHFTTKMNGVANEISGLISNCGLLEYKTNECWKKTDIIIKNLHS